MHNKELFRDATIKTLSIVFAILLWFYVITEQNPVVPKDITIPVRLINLDALSQNNLVLIENPDSFFITIRLKGKKEILDAVNQNTLNAYADVSAYKAKGENTLPVVINGIPEGVAVTSRSEHNIRVNIDNMLTVQRPVTIKVTGNPMGGLANLTPIPTPSEVVLTGAESVVNNIKTVRVDVDIAGVNSNVTKKLPVRLLDEAGRDVAGVKLDTQWINVDVPIANTKRVPIQLVLDGTPSPGYMIASQIVQPGEILVTGDQKSLDLLTIVNTGKVDINNITESLKVPVALELPPGVQLVNANEQINALIDVEKIVTRTIEIDQIEFRNLSDKYTVENAFTGSVKMTVRGPENLVNTAETSILLNVDLASAKEGLASYEIQWTKPLGIEVLETTPTSLALDIKSRE